MTIYTLVLYVAIFAVFLTVLVGIFYKGHKNWLMTYLQNFCGSLFIFSGYVKAVDPMGTAFKMEQYFAEFYYTFKETALSFIAPMFPWFSEHAIAFSVGMIVFEILLGIMLLVGSKPKFTVWAFFLLVVFFTILTGFTYLTGHVPTDANFFEFGKWGPWVETNMKVTDCGCFGDFITMKPINSFLKDIFLLFPSVYFLFRHKDMHQLFSPAIRTGIVVLVTVGFVFFCFRNFMWDEPMQDFRPFKAGTDVRAQKQLEEDAQAAVQITHYKMTNKESGKVVTLPYEQYIKEFKQYPKEEWEFEQIKTKPAIEPTKISDFDISDMEGNNRTEEILNNPDYSFMVLSYKLPSLNEKKTVTTTVNDTTFLADTILIEGSDEMQVVRKVDSVTPRQVTSEVTQFKDAFVRNFTDVLNPVLEKAEAAGYDVFAVTAPNSNAVIDDFRHATQSAYPFYTADDLLIKTIQRSNPGLVLWKDGKVVRKWHIKQLPSFEEIKEAYLQQ